MTEPATRIKVGGHVFGNSFLLAPMSGISDVPFRRMAWKYGAGMVVSEMVASAALLGGLAEMEIKAMSAGLPVHMVQLAGRDLYWMTRAASLAEANGADIIDINMGCPSRRVTNGDCGAALMREPDHAMALIKAVIAAVRIPVTLKMRLGWDEQSINAPQLAAMAVDAGIAMVSVHGRTRNQFYKGAADWSSIRAVREVCKVPLIVNGDIGSLASARTARELSGADGVMIGRAAYGAPWLPGLLAREAGEAVGAEAETLLGAISPEDPYTWREGVLEHYREMISFLPGRLGLRHARKHLGWYLDKAAQVAPQGDFDHQGLRREILTSDKAERVEDLLQAVFGGHSKVARGSHQMGMVT